MAAVSLLNIVDADTELNLEDKFNILSKRRSVFLALYRIKSNRSEKVLWLHTGFGQNIFLFLIRIVTWLS
jgi:hypothetical protein